MKAVILAAGEGRRMRPLTLKTPKPLLRVEGKPLLGYVLEALPSEIDEVIVVVKYLGDQIKKYVNKKKRGVKRRFVQGSDKGNVYSFLATRKYLKDERFLLIYGDEIPNLVNVKNCLEKDLSILTFDGGTYDGVMVLNTDIFDYETTDDQFEVFLREFVRDHDVRLVEAEDFIGGINTPEDLVRVEKEFKKIYG